MDVESSRSFPNSATDKMGLSGKSGIEVTSGNPLAQSVLRTCNRLSAVVARIHCLGILSPFSPLSDILHLSTPTLKTLLPAPRLLTNPALFGNGIRHPTSPSSPVPSFSNPTERSNIFFSSSIFSMVKDPLATVPASGGRPVSRRKDERVCCG